MDKKSKSSLSQALGIDDILHFDFPSPPPALTLARALEILYALGQCPSPESFSSSSLLLSSLQLSNEKVYEPSIRARLGNAAHFCEVVVLKLRTSDPNQLTHHTCFRLISTLHGRVSPRCRAKRKQLKWFQGLSPERQGPNKKARKGQDKKARIQASTVLYVPHLLDSDDP